MAASRYGCRCRCGWRQSDEGVIVKEKILNTGSILLSAAVSAICFVLYGEVSGFRQGVNVADNINEYIPSMFAVHGPNFYDLTTRYYLIIASCVLVYLSGRLLLSKRASLIAAMLPLALALFSCVRLLQFKYDIDETAVLFYRKWLTVSVWYDWFCLSSIVILISIQIYEFIGLYLKQRAVLSAAVVVHGES